MKPSQGKEILNNVLKRGWVRDGDIVYTPTQAAALSILETTERKKRNSKAHRTGWIDDDLNIRNREKQTDMFMTLVKLELGLTVWPEFYFTLEKGYRFDYAIPVGTDLCCLKIAIEVEGGIWAKGLSGHSSGTGITRDMDKSTKANILGWTLIRCTPTALKKEPGKIIDLIRLAIKNLKK